MLGSPVASAARSRLWYTCSSSRSRPRDKRRPSSRRSKARFSARAGGQGRSPSPFVRTRTHLALSFRSPIASHPQMSNLAELRREVSPKRAFCFQRSPTTAAHVPALPLHRSNPTRPWCSATSFSSAQTPSLPSALSSSTSPSPCTSLVSPLHHRTARS